MNETRELYKSAVISAQQKGKSMYQLTVKGNTRYAEFQINPEESSYQTVLLEVFEPEEKNDCLSLVISNPETRSNLEENWMILHGKPWEISLTMDSRYPIAKLETNRIFDILDAADPNTAVTIAYPIEEPGVLIRASQIHRTMRGYAARILSEMFGLKTIYLLPSRYKMV